MITIGIAEDNATEREQLKNAISGYPKDYKLLFAAKDGKDCLQQLKKHPPNILLLDINMPFVTGLIITTWCSYKHADTKIIGVSSHTNENLIREVITEGAKAFISKYFLSPESIIYKEALEGADLLKEAITKVYNSERFIDKLVMNNPELFKPSICSREIIAKDFPNLKHDHILFAILNTTDLSYEEIAALMDISLHTVKSYYQKLANQFKVSGRTNLANYCMRHGLVKFAGFYDDSFIK
jgi:DNA-binding NarL/FixJ family response regulator